MRFMFKVDTHLRFVSIEFSFVSNRHTTSMYSKILTTMLSSIDTTKGKLDHMMTTQ